MAAGRVVFPIIMGLFILGFLGIVVSMPATPASEAPSTRLLRVKEGDSVLIEVTGFYGPLGQGKVFFSTQEERADALPKGDVHPQLQSAPVTYHIQNATDPGPLDAFLIGHRAGETITTTQIPAREAFGEWTDNASLPRILATVPVQVEYNASSVSSSGQNFSVQSYVQSWAGRGFQLREGMTWPCEGTDLWQCQVVNLSVPDDRLVYQRVVQDGDAYPVASLWGDVPTGGDMSWNFTVQSTSLESFQIRLDPPAGATFQFRASPGGPFRAGTYHVVSLDATAIHVQYSPATASDPALIGRDVYYDIEILRITRPS